MSELQVSPDGESPKDDSNDLMNEIKRKNGRLHRSDKNKEWGLCGQLGMINLETFQNQPQGVGLVYDEAMLEPYCTWDENQPEKPDRLTLSYERCQYYGLIDRCKSIQGRCATEEEILTCHSQKYYDLLKESASMTEQELMDLSAKYDGIYFHEKMFNSALLAAGCAIELVSHILDNKVKNGMALIRPPGHHAMSDEANGYCFFNTAALAARHALDKCGLKRILIIDWDVHHGQGIQQAFYDDPRVLYFSIHRYEHGQFWPNLRESDNDYIGVGNARGCNINVPWTDTGMTDGDYLAILQQILMPVAYEFSPELIIVCSGYDAAIGDPEGESLVSPAAYAHFVHMLKPLAEGKICVLLEGGYCMTSLRECVALTLRALLDDPPPLLGPYLPPRDSSIEIILQVLRVLRPYWKCLAFHDDAESDYLPDMFKDTEIPKKGVVFSTAANKPETFSIRGDYIVYSKELGADFDNRVENLIAQTKLLTIPNRTCLAYDPRMLLHRSKTNSGHPENPDRIRRIYEKHLECGLLKRCKILKPRVASEEELALVHNVEYIREVRGFQHLTLQELDHTEDKFDSIYLSQEVYESATVAVGCTLNAVDDILTSRSRNGVAIVRPPGHHAEIEEGKGFCFFNSVAIAAEYSKKRYGLKRICILDWDVHHGNGIQHKFEDDPSVLYISLHRYDNGFFYPGGYDGDYYMVGTGRGTGFNINIPWNGRKTGNSEYIAAFQQIVMPVLHEFAPELVLVSAGFDAARGDPLGGLDVTPEGFAHMTHMLSGVAAGRVLLALEGGYNLTSISDCMVMCTSVLLGDCCPRLPPIAARGSAASVIKQVLDEHQKYWRCLRYRVSMPSREETKLWLGDVKDIAKHEEVENSLEEQDVQRLADELEKFAVSDIEGGNRMGGEGAFDGAMSVSLPSVEDSAELLLGAAGGTDHTRLPSIGELFQDITGVCDTQELYAVTPLTWCPHLDSIHPVPSGGLDTKAPCMECGHVGENWVCLTCYEVHCGRYIQEHMLMHGLVTEHRLTLSYADLSVWCYGCDYYIHHMALMSAKRAAHIHKFGEDVPGH